MEKKLPLKDFVQRNILNKVFRESRQIFVKDDEDSTILLAISRLWRRSKGWEVPHVQDALFQELGKRD